MLFDLNNNLLTQQHKQLSIAAIGALAEIV